MRTLYVLLFLLVAFFEFLPAQVGYFEVTEINQIDFESPFEAPNSEFGEAKIRYYIPENEPAAYFNMIYLPSPSGFEMEWAIQNVPLTHFSDTLEVSVWFDLDPFDDYPYEFDFNFLLAGINITNEPLLEAPPLDLFLDFTVGDKPYNCGHFTVPAGTHFPSALFPVSMQEWGPDITLPGIKTRGCDVPNIDLDSLNHNADDPDYPGYSGDWNACVQAATANSFGWLRNQHDEIGDVLNDFYGTDEESLRRMLVDLDIYMEGNGEGVLIDTMVRGKLAFIDFHEIPVRVKFQDVNNEEPMNIPSPDDLYGHFAEDQTDTSGTIEERVSAEWIYQEFCEDEDVEINYNCCKYYYDATGQGGHVDDLCYAHSVNLVGAAKFGDDYAIQWKDDLLQDRAGGLQMPSTRLVRDTVMGVVYHLLENLSDTIWTDPVMGTLVQRCFIREVVSESYDEDITFEIDGTSEFLQKEWDVQIQPNPVKAGQQILISMTLPDPSVLTVVLRHSTGQKILSANYNLDESSELDLHIPESLSPGWYLLELQTNEGRHTGSIVIL